MFKAQDRTFFEVGNLVSLRRYPTCAAVITEALSLHSLESHYRVFVDLSGHQDAHKPSVSLIISLAELERHNPTVSTRLTCKTALTAYQALLACKPGAALYIGGHRYALLDERGHLRYAFEAGLGELALDELFPFDAAAWDGERMCWCADEAGTETAFRINYPRHIPLPITRPADLARLKACRAIAEANPRQAFDMGNGKAALMTINGSFAWAAIGRDGTLERDLYDFHACDLPSQARLDNPVFISRDLEPSDYDDLSDVL